MLLKEEPMCPQQKESVCFSTNLQVIVALLSGHQTSTCLWIHVNLSSWGLGPNQNEWVSPKWMPFIYIYIYIQKIPSKTACPHQHRCCPLWVLSPIVIFCPFGFWGRQGLKAGRFKQSQLLLLLFLLSISPLFSSKDYSALTLLS